MAEPALKGKRWEPAREEELLRTWEPDLYRFDPDSGKPIFTIDTPPPYPSGLSWHIGAVASYSLIDMIARSLRMRGFEVLFPFGLDRNGINIERTVERKYDRPLYEWDRQEFIDRCREEVD
ncbi:MAG: class I tRNA ligase family protein, partial [Thermoplasmata archaeon]|nr:class I tRNA ligase family protein [Thermoplasmata archaeon]